MDRDRARPSIKDVAEAAGVSLGTVSNVLNRPDSVAPKTRARVQRAIDQLGYVRNESARQLRAGHSRTVGLVVLDVANPFFTDVAKGVESLTDERDMVVTMCNSGEETGRENRHLDVLLEQRVLGVLITPVSTHNPRLDLFIDRGIPVVLLDRGAGRRQMCSVAVDDVRGGRLAGAHLVEQGHRRLAFAGGPLSIDQVAERLQGLREAVTEAGGDADDVMVCDTPALRIDAGRLAGQRLASMPADERPTAVFCANDLVALGVLQEAIRHGLHVPKDLAIVGYDDIQYAGGAAVPLSSVRQPREELGRAAAELLFDEINDGDRHRHRQVVFEPELVVRDSSRLSLRAP